MAEDRKARLAALAARAGRSKKTDASSPTEDSSTNVDDTPMEEATQPSLRFRNYVPKDASLDDAAAGMDKQQAQTTISVDTKLEVMAQRAKRQKTEKENEKTPLEQALLKAKLDNVMEATSRGAVSGGGDLETNMAAIAPKKVNWDLKRDIKSKLNRLERRTERAIVELLRERLEKEATEEAGDNMDDESDLD
uniref:Coiled-coil domain-containing protein 12 n=1 Tax=Helicotheca tamesis TaxID=374047 RepID=A0A7S2MMT2_9STRA